MKNIRVRGFILLAVLHICFINVVSANSYAQNRDFETEFVDYINKVKNLWEIPGLSISVIKDGQILYSAGFGVKEMGLQDSVDCSTLFQIGSVTKSFTALTIASMVDQGLLSWEDSVKNILPDFRMYDKWVEQNMQVKDIMTHRSGLQGQLGTYIPNMGYSRDDIYNMLPLIKPKYSFRSSYEYNNITFIIAAKIIEKLTGKSWEDNVRERVFLPLQMNRSIVTGEEFDVANNVSVAHNFSYAGYYNSDSTITDSLAIYPLVGDERALHWLTVIGPAGSISSTAHDMSKYLSLYLNNGVLPNGERLISKSQIDFLKRGFTITSQDSARTTLYSNCWFVEQNSRYRLYFHTGTTWGFTALVAYLPELNLGVSLLFNSEIPSAPRMAILRRVIDYFFNEKELSDLNESSYSEWISSSRKRVATVKKEEPASKQYLDSQIVGKYYKDDLFGGAKITLENGELFIEIGPKNIKVKLEHVNGDKYSYRTGGYTYKMEFIGDGSKLEGFDLSFGYSENFGLWSKVE